MSEGILGSLPLFPKIWPAERLSGLFQLLTIPVLLICFNYNNVPGTRYIECNPVRNTLFQIRIPHLLSIQTIALHLIEINGLLFFTSSEKELNTPFRAKCVSGMKIVWLLMLPYYSLTVRGHNSVCLYRVLLLYNIIAVFASFLFTFTLKFSPFRLLLSPPSSQLF